MGPIFQIPESNLGALGTLRAKFGLGGGVPLEWLGPAKIPILAPASPLKEGGGFIPFLRWWGVCSLFCWASHVKGLLSRQFHTQPFLCCWGACGLLCWAAAYQKRLQGRGFHLSLHWWGACSLVWWVAGMKGLPSQEAERWQLPQWWVGCALLHTPTHSFETVGT